MFELFGSETFNETVRWAYDIGIPSSMVMMTNKIQ